jgi:two-component system, cell cycle response regulator
MMRILIAEDDVVSRRLLEMTLKGWGYEVVAVDNGCAAAERLEGPDAPSLAILDWEMPGMSGLDVCRALRRRSEGTYVYVLLLTGRDGTEDTVDGLEAGADDYMVKPVSMAELRSRLRSGQRVLKLQQELIAARDQLKHEATHDALTGVRNRGGVIEQLEIEHARALREKTALSVILFDVDHFKCINDEHGHPTGDDVLREITRRPRSILRSYDGLGRYGGEEFLIVMPGLDAEDALVAAERVRRSIGTTPLDTRSGPLEVTVSMGVSSLIRGIEESAEGLIGRADAALYEAKRTGRNRVVVASPPSRPRTRPSRTGMPPARLPGALASKVIERLREMLGDQNDREIAPLVDAYVQAATGDVEAMCSAAAASDWARVRSHAHKLRGASDNFGIDAVARCAASLERSDGPATDVLDALVALVEDVKQELAGTTWPKGEGTPGPGQVSGPSSIRL